MKNIVLIGMPGAGKSTIGVLLAKSVLMDFTDTDLLIQREYSKSLCDIINEKGIEEFLKIENDVIRKAHFENAVIATGGSAVYGKEAMEKLKKESSVIYLKVEPDVLEKRIDNIHTRGIAMEKGTTINELYIQRAPLYEEYADITVDCSCLTAEECVDEITRKLKV